MGFGGFEGAALDAVSVGQCDLLLCCHLRRKRYVVASGHHQHLYGEAVHALTHVIEVAVVFGVEVFLNF